VPRSSFGPHESWITLETPSEWSRLSRCICSHHRNTSTRILRFDRHHCVLTQVQRPSRDFTNDEPTAVDIKRRNIRGLPVPTLSPPFSKYSTLMATSCKWTPEEDSVLVDAVLAGTYRFGLILGACLTLEYQLDRGSVGIQLPNVFQEGATSPVANGGSTPWILLFAKVRRDQPCLASRLHPCRSMDNTRRRTSYYGCAKAWSSLV
jgi:hypothetical protein